MDIWEIKREALIPVWQDRIRDCRGSGLTVRAWCARERRVPFVLSLCFQCQKQVLLMFSARQKNERNRPSVLFLRSPSILLQNRNRKPVEERRQFLI